MRVLHLTSGNLFGGVESVLLTIARHRDTCPTVEPHFAVCFEGRLLDELRTAGANVHLFPPVRARYPWTVWSLRRQLSRLLAEIRFDAAVAHMSWPHAIYGPAVLRAGVPLIHYAHGPYSEQPEWTDRQARRAPASFIVANSEYTLGVVRSVLPGIPGRVVFYPIPVDEQQQQERAAARRELGIPDGHTIVLQAGRLEHWKGCHVHIEALAHLKHLPDWTSWIVGGAQTKEQQQYEQDLRSRAASHGLQERIRFWGQRSDVPRLMAAADIFCQPNVGPEPFGLVYVEAMSAGLAIVGSRLGGVREIVTDDCGILVSPGDAEAVASTLRTLIADASLRRTLGKAGAGRAKQLCDPAVRIPELYDTISRVARQP